MTKQKPKILFPAFGGETFVGGSDFYVTNPALLAVEKIRKIGAELPFEVVTCALPVRMTYPPQIDTSVLHPQYADIQSVLLKSIAAEQPDIIIGVGVGVNYPSTMLFTSAVSKVRKEYSSNELLSLRSDGELNHVLHSTLPHTAILEAARNNDLPIEEGNVSGLWTMNVAHYYMLELLKESTPAGWVSIPLLSHQVEDAQKYTATAPGMDLETMTKCIILIAKVSAASFEVAQK